MTLHITYFVHGTTTDNAANKSTGWLPGELSDLGRKQMEKLRGMIRGKKFDAVFCSDLDRAIESAEITFGDGSVLIMLDKRLRECNYGDLNGTDSNIVEPLQEKNIITKFPNGESYEDVKKRVLSFLEDTKKKYNNKHIAIVAHKAPQLCIEVLTKNKTWEQAFAEDWRKTKAWQPGWDYEF